MLANIDHLLEALRDAGGDTASIEVKSAAGGLPDSLASSLSALANLPGGGVLILGLDETHGFRPVDIGDPQKLKQGLGSRARQLTPPVRLVIEDARVGGKPVVVADVGECDPSAKPCRVTASGKAYLRSHDGDYELSSLEQQGFLAARSAPRSDRQPVAGTSIADLDVDLVAAWRNSIAAGGRQGLGRFVDDQPELLRRAGVVTSSGELSLAGLLTLGTYPQQYFPRLVVQVAVDTGRPGERARNARAIDGPIPAMLAGTMDWLRANIGSTTQTRDDGTVREVPDYPLVALRELVANALVHRDLSAWADGQAIEVRVARDKLVIANPGGLYGITADRLGREHVTSARNSYLVSLCQHARTVPDGERVIEALATGLPVVAQELADAELPPPRFFDAGIRFTVMLRRRPATMVVPAPAAAVARSPEPAVAGMGGTNLAAVLSAVRAAPGSTVAELSAATGLAPARARRAVTELRSRGLIEAVASSGRAKRYAATAVGDPTTAG